MHLAMKKSKGLFSKALMESGGFGPWAAQHMEWKEVVFQRLMQQLQCGNLECLLNQTADELLEAYVQMPQGRCCENMFANVQIPWSPTIDGVELKAHPLELLKEGKVNPVPTVIGSTLDDGAEFFNDKYENMSSDEFLSYFQKEFQSSKATAELYSSESHPFVPGHTDGWWSAIRAVTDLNFYCPAHFARRNLASMGLQVFGYVFAHSSNGLIVNHNADLPFVFQTLSVNASSEEKLLASEVARAWYRFAAGSQDGLAWPQQSARRAPILKFQVSSKGGNQVIDGNYRDSKCAFMIQWLNHTLKDFNSLTTWPKFQPVVV